MVEKNIYLVCTAESEDYPTDTESYAGRLLAEKRQKQLELLAIRCRNINADKIYTSPSEQAVDTCSVLTMFHDVPICRLADLADTGPDEDVHECFLRTTACFKRVVSEKDKTVFIVTHSEVIRCILCDLLFGDINRLDEISACGSTGMTRIILHEGMERQIEYINDVSHLTSIL